jgi:hypothetical protein
MATNYLVPQDRPNLTDFSPELQSYLTKQAESKFTTTNPKPVAPTQDFAPPVYTSYGRNAPPPRAYVSPAASYVEQSAQTIAAPQLSKLRRALQQTTRGSTYEDNPARKRDLLRGAMEGFGTSLGDVITQSRSQAMSEANQQAGVTNQSIADQNAFEQNQFQNEVTNFNRNQDAAISYGEQKKAADYATKYQAYQDQESQWKSDYDNAMRRFYSQFGGK